MGFRDEKRGAEPLCRLLLSLRGHTKLLFKWLWPWKSGRVPAGPCGFVSRWEMSEANVCGEKPLKAGKLSCCSYCPQPLVPLQSGSRCGPWCETTSFAAPRHNPTFSSLSKGPGTNGRSSRALSEPDPSRCCGEALSFLASGHAVIPLIQRSKHMRNMFEKTGDSYMRIA